MAKRRKVTDFSGPNPFISPPLNGKRETYKEFSRRQKNYKAWEHNREMRMLNLPFYSITDSIQLNLFDDEKEYQYHNGKYQHR